jgi:hypothetical protein
MSCDKTKTENERAECDIGSKCIHQKSRTAIIGWGFSSVVEHLPSKHKALGSVLSSEKKRKEKKRKEKKRKEKKRKEKKERMSIITCDKQQQQKPSRQNKLVETKKDT